MQGGSVNTFALSSYDFHLPQELIAQYPAERREDARLLVVDRSSGKWYDESIADLPGKFNPGDQLVCNNTKVLAARLKGCRPTGGAVELLLLEPSTDEEQWWAMARPARKLPVGSDVILQAGHTATIIAIGDDGRRLLSFSTSLETILNECGELPLPPYINRSATTIDNERYQTIYATHSGAIAAPTAGLHFSSHSLEQIKKRGVETVEVTLHVGAGTFKPVSCDDIRSHPIHSERCWITEEAAKTLNRSRASHTRRIAVGTTSCRTLESCADETGLIQHGMRTTQIYIYPGYTFKATEALLTNFHLPRSSLLMLISAFMGYDLMCAVYQHAIEKRYRFFSYGDAMLIL
jgi:S-adenosylmethionine:tRNA ribosyltransferase-isomerase